MSLATAVGLPSPAQLDALVSGAIDRAVAGGATTIADLTAAIHAEVTGDVTNLLNTIFADAQALESPIVAELQKFNATAADILDQVRWVAHGGVHISFGQPDSGTPQVKP